MGGHCTKINYLRGSSQQKKKHVTHKIATFRFNIGWKFFYFGVFFPFFIFPPSFQFPKSLQVRDYIQIAFHFTVFGLQA